MALKAASDNRMIIGPVSLDDGSAVTTSTVTGRARDITTEDVLANSEITLAEIGTGTLTFDGTLPLTVPFVRGTDYIIEFTVVLNGKTGVFRKTETAI